MSNPKPSLVAHITEYEMYLALRYLKGLKDVASKKIYEDEYIYPWEEIGECPLLLSSK